MASYESAGPSGLRTSLLCVPELTHGAIDYRSFEPKEWVAIETEPVPNQSVLVFVCFVVASCNFVDRTQF